MLRDIPSKEYKMESGGGVVEDNFNMNNINVNSHKLCWLHVSFI